MGFKRRSSGGKLSKTSSNSSLDQVLRDMTLPLAPREDKSNMSDETRRERFSVKCRRGSMEPWRSAQPLPTSQG